MRRISAKTRKRIEECRPFREQFKAEVGRCEVCGKRWGLQIHEIARGSSRSAALDKRYAILVLCFECHLEVDGWPRAKQLAVLKRSRPADLDLEAFNVLCGNDPGHITMEDVDAHASSTT